jgi:molybdopterin/thiamine biosynthesis adenylyltransferase
MLAERLLAMNTQIVIANEPVSFDRGVAEALLSEADLVIDATDNHETRLVIDATTLAARIPWVMASAVQMAGQIAAFSALREEGCYHCLAPEPDVSVGGACARLGILGPVVGAVAMEEVLRGVAILTQVSPPRWGLIDIVDFRLGERRSLQLTKRADCPNCGFTSLS